MEVPLKYDELVARLNDAEQVIQTLLSHQADAVVSEGGVHLLRLHETDRALQAAKSSLEKMLAQRTQELEVANQQLLREIADRKQAEDRLASIIESAMDAIVTVDGQMNVVIFNTAAERVFGYPASEVIGQPIDRFIPEGFRQVHREHIRRFGETGETSRSMSSPGTLYGLHKDGTEFPVEAAISHVKAGRDNLYTVILRDISRRKFTEAALIRSEKLAGVGRLAATIAHEINNPLSSIGNLLFLLRDDVASTAGKQYLALAETELQRAGHIVQNTLGFSRQSALPERIRVAELVNGVLVLLDRKLQDKRITHHVRCLPEDLEIVAIAGEIRQVLWNLLMNAVDAVPENGRIEVRASGIHRLKGRSNGGVQITVADNGVGIGPETVRHILEPFFTTKSNGTGLGLWVSHEIIRKHAGSLRVRSRTGLRHGTVFSAILPSDAIASQATSAKQNTAPVTRRISGK